MTEDLMERARAGRALMDSQRTKENKKEVECFLRMLHPDLSEEKVKSVVDATER